MGLLDPNQSRADSQANPPAGEDRFRGAFEDAPMGMVLATIAGRFVKVNAAFCELLGYSETELLGRDIHSITHPQDLELTTQQMQKIQAGEIRYFDLTKRHIHKDGHDVWVRVGVSRMRPTGGERLLVGLVQNVTEQKHNEWLEQDRREILEMVAHDQPLPSAFYAVAKMVEQQSAGSRACVLLLNDGALHTFAPSFPQTLIDAIGRRPVTFASGLVDSDAPPDQPQVAAIATHPAWEGIREEAAALGLRTSWALSLRGNDGAAVGLLVVCCPKDRGPTATETAGMTAALKLSITAVEHHHTTRQLAHLVRHDPLTGVPNRIFYEDRLDQALSQAKRTGTPLGLLAMDLNRFKHINDTLGHQVGDSLLQQFAQRLRGVIRESDTLARVGGDEFMIILPDIGTRENALEIVRLLKEALAATPFNIGDRDITASSSIGTALYPDDAADAVTLQRVADAAMYRDKEETRAKNNTPGRAA